MTSLGTVTFLYDDGGRKDAGYIGYVRDCAARSIAIATGLTYNEAYDEINRLAKRERPRGLKKRSTARDGVHMVTMQRFLVEEMGWRWHSTMGIGTGCTVHLRADELPHDRLIVRASKHYTAMINGTIRDTYDPSREGTRCVYGYWSAR